MLQKFVSSGLINSSKASCSSSSSNRLVKLCSSILFTNRQRSTVNELHRFQPRNTLLRTSSIKSNGLLHCDLIKSSNYPVNSTNLIRQIRTRSNPITNPVTKHRLQFKMTPNTNDRPEERVQPANQPAKKPTAEVQNGDDEIVCKFGVLTDAQFANCDDRAAWYNKDKTRYYRGAITHLKKAFDHWNNEMTEKPTFVLQLGDLIDGLNNEEAGCNSLDALEETLKIFEEFPNIPVFHAVGNHELYNFHRSDIALLFRESLINRGRLNPDLVHLQLDFHDLNDENTMLYYKFVPIKGIKVLALDCFDISVIGHSSDSAKYKEAAEILCKNNHSNFDRWDFDEHLEGLNKRFQTQNGGFSENQLKWLQNELEESEREGEKVIVFGHTGLHPDSCDASCLAYNYDKVLEIFDRVNCVIAYLSGHAHQSGYSVDENNVHYIVLHGIIETNPDQDAYSTITITKNRMIVEGRGSEQSLDLPLKSVEARCVEARSDAETSDEPTSESSEATSETASDKFSEYEELPASSSCVSIEVSV